MAAPNLLSPTIITGKTAEAQVTTSLAAVLSNAAASGKAIKINTVRVANVDSGGSAVTVDVTFYRGTTHRYLIKGASIAAGKALVVSDKNEYIYLEEGDALYAQASSASGLDVTINYEEIS